MLRILVERIDRARSASSQVHQVAEVTDLPAKSPEARAMTSLMHGALVTTGQLRRTSPLGPRSDHLAAEAQDFDAACVALPDEVRLWPLSSKSKRWDGSLGRSVCLG